MVDLATGYILPIGSNATLELKMTDKGEPGANIDTYGITIWGSNNTLLFSSNWSGTVTNEAAINGGNIQVNSSTATASARINTIDVSPAAGVSSQATYFALKALPNPTTSYFNVKLESGIANVPMTLIVRDVVGRIVEVKKGLTAGQTLQLGTNYRPGMYFVELIQGDNNRILKLIKQPD
jgi:hypothetical protein